MYTILQTSPRHGPRGISYAKCTVTAACAQTMDTRQFFLLFFFFSGLGRRLKVRIIKLGVSCCFCWLTGTKLDAKNGILIVS